MYEAISVIEFKGTLRPNGDSDGHYICDIKDNSSNKWFKTDDGTNPVQINTSEVSKNGYVVLYKKFS